ncbi:MAG: hypothetical protein QOG06_1601 [Gaiellaceae bacterium]|nr:hypothetical protein [Gaiellaceae bacterium]
MHNEPEQHGAPPAEEPAGADQPAEERLEGFRRQWQPRLYFRIVVLGLIVAYGIAFVLENNKHVDVHFVFAKARVSLIWLILLSVALGLLLGVLVSQLYRRRRRRK